MHNFAFVSTSAPPTNAVCLPAASLSASFVSLAFAKRLHVYQLSYRCITSLRPPATSKSISSSRPVVNREKRRKRKDLCKPEVPSSRDGVSLSSQAVASQVFSTLVSLTSVFGMGTGGSSPPSTPSLEHTLFFRYLQN